MRALGVPMGTASRTLALPLMAVAVVSILIGSGVAWVYTVRTVARSNALQTLQNFAVETYVPAGTALGCILGEMLLTLAFALAMLRRIGKASPLALLHGDTAKKHRRKEARAAGEVSVLFQGGHVAATEILIG